MSDIVSERQSNLLDLVVDIRQRPGLHIVLLDCSLAQILERDEVVGVQKMVGLGDLARKTHSR